MVHPYLSLQISHCATGLNLQERPSDTRQPQTKICSEIEGRAVAVVDAQAQAGLQWLALHGASCRSRDQRLAGKVVHSSQAALSHCYQPCTSRLHAHKLAQHCPCQALTAKL